MIYKGYNIEFNIYGQNEYTVEFEGDDVWFTSLPEAKNAAFGQIKENMNQKKGLAERGCKSFF